MGQWRKNLNSKSRRNSRKTRLDKATAALNTAIKNEADKAPVFAVLPDGTKIMDTGMPGLTSTAFVDKSE